MTSAALVAIGNRASPSDAFAFSHSAAAIWAEPAAVSTSRAKFPCASADCSVKIARRACVSACLRASPSSPSRPSAARRALTSLCLIEIPYFSIGSVSPRNTAPSASTASAVVPPYILARSAPIVINLSVVGTRLDCSTPRFLSCEPMTLANS